MAVGDFQVVLFAVAQVITDLAAKMMQIDHDLVHAGLCKGLNLPLDKGVGLPGLTLAWGSIASTGPVVCPYLPLVSWLSWGLWGARIRKPVHIE